jgi:hypothetical protein
VPIGNSHQNVEFFSVAPREIMVVLGLQSQGCKLLELIPMINISIVNLLCPENFLYTPFFYYRCVDECTFSVPPCPWANQTNELRLAFSFSLP